ncbi:uncharacterized protein [Typha angustifolia]|uniref:uncharacterized protein n=1 Tax=Typha angustifolia TaxID=59011 RepID=UPI003C2F4AD0
MASIVDSAMEVRVDVSFQQRQEHELWEAEIRVLVSRIHCFSSGIPPVEEVTDSLSHSCAPRRLRDPAGAKSTISSLLALIGHPVREEVVIWRNFISSIAQDAAYQALESGVASFKILANIMIFQTYELVEPNQRPIPWGLLPRVEEIDNVLTFSVDGGVFGGSRATVRPPQGSPTEKLERVKFTGGSGSDQMTTTATACVICMDDFEQGSELIKMPCSHLFHESCLTRWLERSPVCPLCRFSLPA